jgi:hypothetical protein
MARTVLSGFENPVDGGDLAVFFGQAMVPPPDKQEEYTGSSRLSREERTSLSIWMP